MHEKNYAHAKEKIAELIKTFENSGIYLGVETQKKEKIGSFEIQNSTNVSGVKFILPTAHKDVRGQFSELVNPDLGFLFPDGIHQISESQSVKGTLRGMHFQTQSRMVKLMRVTRGCVTANVVDLRKESSTFLKVHRQALYAGHMMLYVPHGCAVGFYAREDTTMNYVHGAAHRPEYAFTIRHDDPDLNIIWPTDNIIMSPKDWRGMTLKEWLTHPESDLL